MFHSNTVSLPEAKEKQNTLHSDMAGKSHVADDALPDA